MDTNQRKSTSQLSSNNKKTQKETFNTREWIEMHNDEIFWRSIIKQNSSDSFTILIQSGKKDSKTQKEIDTQEQTFEYDSNNGAIESLHQILKTNLASGYLIRKSEEEIFGQPDSVGSYRSAKGLLSNLTIEDSNSVSNQEMEGSVLAKRDKYDSRMSQDKDVVQKQLKVKSAKKSPKNKNQSPKHNKSLDKEGLVEEIETKTKTRGTKRERIRQDIESTKLIEQVKIHGTLITLDNLTPAKSKKPSISKSQVNTNLDLKVKRREQSKSASKNWITPKTPQSIRSILASTILSPPKVDYIDIAQFNNISVGDNVFLSKQEIDSVFNSKPPLMVPSSNFKGVYLERKVFSQYVPSLSKEVTIGLNEIVTEYYSLQIDQNYCYFEYGVIEEPDAMLCELHESYDFIESYCLAHRVKQLRIEIGFEEKREKLVYSLNLNLIDTIKQNGELYFKHSKRICEDPDTSFKVLQSQEKSKKTKETIGTGQDERELAITRDIQSGNRRSNQINSSGGGNRVKSVFSIADANNTGEQLTGNQIIEEERLEQEEVQMQIEKVRVGDKEPLVNVREDIGQSDLDIIYDKLSHSNPLHDFSDIDINYEFKSQIELSAAEKEERALYMDKFLNGLIKNSTSLER